jgi:6-phosphogluconolactonase (cycloisomerase 2 family)
MRTVARFGLIAMLLLAAVAEGGCGGESLFSGVTSSSTGGGGSGGGSGGGGSSFAYVTNFNGDVSEFTVNSSGGLTLIGTVTAGAKNGPVGLAVTPSNNYLYVANFADSLVHEFSINSTTGALKNIGTISTLMGGKTGGPSGVAIDSGGNFVYVTNQTGGSIAQYTIGSDGTLTALGIASGLTAPEGITANGSSVYVADNGGGVIDAYAIGSGGALSLINTLPSQGSTNGSPIQVALDPVNPFLYATDITNGLLGVYLIASDGGVSFLQSFSTSGGQPIGVAVGGGFAYTANFAANTITQFATSSTGALQAAAPASGSLSGPNGIAVSSDGTLVYAVNRSNGSVTVFNLNLVDAQLNQGSTASTVSGSTSSSPRFMVLVP